MKTAEAIKKEIQKRLKQIGNSTTNLETLIHCDWYNCLLCVLDEDENT